LTTHRNLSNPTIKKFDKKSAEEGRKKSTEIEHLLCQTENITCICELDFQKN